MPSIQKRNNFIMSMRLARYQEPISENVQLRITLILILCQDVFRRNGAISRLVLVVGIGSCGPLGNSSNIHGCEESCVRLKIFRSVNSLDENRYKLFTTANGLLPLVFLPLFASQYCRFFVSCDRVLSKAVVPSFFRTERML